MHIDGVGREITIYLNRLKKISTVNQTVWAKCLCHLCHTSSHVQLVLTECENLTSFYLYKSDIDFCEVHIWIGQAMAIISIGKLDRPIYETQVENILCTGCSWSHCSF